MNGGPTAAAAAGRFAPATGAAPLSSFARRALFSLLAAAVILRVSLALALPNMLWFDEVIETLEQGHRLAFGYGLVPWEFRTGTRSWIFPALLAAIMRPAAALGPGAFGYLAGVALALSALSMAPVLAAFAWARRDGDVPALVAASVLATWFELVYLAPKAFSEVAAAHALVLALLLSTAPGDSSAAGGVPRSPGGGWKGARPIAAGALLALAALVRVQLAPAVVVAWITSPTLRRRWRGVAVGALVAVALAAAVDWVTWGGPLVSYWRNVRVNLLQEKSSVYGVLPWWAYGAMAAKVWGWWAPLLLALAAMGARRRPALLAVAAAVVLPHLPIPHKEYRFAYPAVMLVVLLAGLGTAEVVAWVGRRGDRARRLAAAGALAAWLAASAGRGYGFDNARTLQDLPPGPNHWIALNGALRACRAASLLEDPCGVALLRLPWTETGAYAYLHQDVPLYEIADAAELARRGPSFDVAIGWFERGEDPGPFRPVRCFRGGTCVFRRPGGCVPDPARRLERLLEERGE